MARNQRITCEIYFRIERESWNQKNN